MKKEKPPVLTDYVTAMEACEILHKRLGHPVSNRHLSQLAKRKKNPVRTQLMGNRLLYLRSDIEQTTIRQRTDHNEAAE